MGPLHVCHSWGLCVCVDLGGVIFDKIIQGFLPKAMINQLRLPALWLTGNRVKVILGSET